MWPKVGKATVTQKGICSASKLLQYAHLAILKKARPDIYTVTY